MNRAVLAEAINALRVVSDCSGLLSFANLLETVFKKHDAGKRLVEWVRIECATVVVFMPYKNSPECLVCRLLCLDPTQSDVHRR